ncbi:MAG TPA: hypothetical protein VLA66_06130, partial [Thermoanaerobaculia bacterium]|nr:hypothetical protein [Thermoanaerobaculia bacterium]
MGGAEPSVALHLDGWLDVVDGAEVSAPAASHGALLTERYERLGEAFLDRIEGRFALVLEDRARRRAILARDGLGHQGLAYVLDRERFLAAADPADLVGREGVGDCLDPVRLAEFFASEELSGPRTVFEGVRAVLPGEVLVVEAEREG